MLVGAIVPIVLNLKSLQNMNIFKPYIAFHIQLA